MIELFDFSSSNVQVNLDLAKRLSARAAKTRALANKAANMPTAALVAAQQELLNASAYMLIVRCVRPARTVTLAASFPDV